MNTSTILNDALAIGEGISVSHVFLIILITTVAVIGLIALCNGFLFSVIKAIKKLFTIGNKGDSEQ